MVKTEKIENDLKRLQKPHVTVSDETKKRLRDWGIKAQFAGIMAPPTHGTSATFEEIIVALLDAADQRWDWERIGKDPE